MVVVKQSEPVRPYTGTTSYKAYKEYFERICVCNEWKTQTECARHLVVAMDGAASETARGLKAEKDSDLALIWEALYRRFGFVDEPEADSLLRRKFVDGILDIELQRYLRLHATSDDFATTVSKAR